MFKCECFDPGCAWHVGAAECHSPACVTLYRIDLEPQDEGVQFCEDCAQDAIESGVFSDDPGELEAWEAQRRYEARLAFADLW